MKITLPIRGEFKKGEKMKIMNKELMAVLALVVAGAGVAQAETWTGLGDGVSYADTNNWDVPATAFSGSTRDINGAYTVERAVDVTVNRTFVSGGAVLNVSAGAHNDSQSGNTIRNFVGNGSQGTVNMSGTDTAYGIGHVLAIAHSSNSDGAFYQTDGALNVYRGGNSLISGYGGLFANGHSMSIGGNSSNTGVTGIYEISGGSLSTRVGVAVGNNGIFSVVGSGASSIRLGGSNDDSGWFALSSDGTLRMSIDDGGVTPIFVEEKDNTSTVENGVEFQLGSELDLSFLGTPAEAGIWTLLELENSDITDSGLAFAAGVDSSADDGIGWSFSIDNSGDNGLLTATYAIPEPATLGLFGLVGGGMLFVRRRFMM
jgi:hypothetical protein